RCGRGGRPGARSGREARGEGGGAGWAGGCPAGLRAAPPAPARALRGLGGPRRSPDDVVAVVPPDLVPATVEKVAINAVLAGCRPAYLPVVLAAVEAACTGPVNMHGLVRTTYFSGPGAIVNRPIAGEIGLKCGRD